MVAAIATAAAAGADCCDNGQDEGAAGGGYGKENITRVRFRLSNATTECPGNARHGVSNSLTDVAQC